MYARIVLQTDVFMARRRYTFTMFARRRTNNDSQPRERLYFYVREHSFLSKAGLSLA